ncbi:(2Fe-2S)-binding protein [Paenibacillus massiliensis]|uniref:(2Fe-2S)-binding protein n=1 Tax=Paenibacillus massiliensis TaxID=225917 RepID=UPI00036FA255|nr:(2Fe-2S)-binding protein [Paenibacillus massiliensis]
MRLCEDSRLSKEYGITLRADISQLSLDEAQRVMAHNDKGVYRLIDLLNPQLVADYLDHYTRIARAEDRQVAAAFTAGWIGAIPLAFQYGLSIYNTAADFSLSNLSLRLWEHNGRARVDFVLEHWAETLAPLDVDARQNWLRQQWTALYKGQLGLLLKQLAEVSGIAETQLWGQWPSRFYREQQWLAEELDEPVLRERVKDDYQLLRDEADASQVFGCRRNPFAVKIVHLEPLVPNRLTVMKNACCQFYRVEGQDYCYTCPRLTRKQRQHKFEEYCAKQT